MDNGSPGPWFTATYSGRCPNCRQPYEEGDRIRATGHGGYECCEDDPAAAQAMQSDRYVGTTDDEMGF
jgi:hypothetical protein